MRYRLIATLVAFLTFSLTSGCQPDSPAAAEPADLVLTNGYVYTADEDRRR